MTKRVEDSPDGGLIQGGARSPELVRGIGLRGAVALNMIDMIGVGPFITIPLIIAAMGGPQAMLGWIVGAVIVACDGMIWAELGAALPGSGGSYRYLKQMYGPDGAGKFMSFLFIWQLTFSAPLSIASGCIGLGQYASYIFPSIGGVLVQEDLHPALPLIGSLDVSFVITGATFVAMGCCLLAVLLLYNRITIINRLAQYLWVGVLATIVWIIASAVAHFDPGKAFDFPQDAFVLSPHFFNGLGAGLLFAIYDYWGYYNVCFIGDEIVEPGRNIPRAILWSIGLVAAIYLVMNISIIGVIPWRELGETASSDARKYVVAVFMQRIYGGWAGSAAAVLIMWTALASVFSLLLGYSRVPFAAASEGDYFRAFSKVHPERRFPVVSLLVLGGVATLLCTLRLSDVIGALVVIRLMVQFLAQTVGLVVLRRRRPDLPRPFRVWLYPIPVIVACAGFLYVLVRRDNFLREIRYAVVLIIVGAALYAGRAWKRGEWPFRNRTA
jgi:amino acid transporter